MINTKLFYTPGWYIVSALEISSIFIKLKMFPPGRPFGLLSQTMQDILFMCSLSPRPTPMLALISLCGNFLFVCLLHQPGGSQKVGASRLRTSSQSSQLLHAQRVRDQRVTI